jgi:N-acetylglucosaminyldiphosphoundecaprenol N-acetyl-beta-D-mannosaminyltransferase
VILFGIGFVDGSYGAIRQRLDEGGLMVVPAAPALATIKSDEQYHSALKQSDFAIFDSGLLCLLLRVFKRLRVRKLSGLAFLRGFLSDVSHCKPGELFLVDPDETSSVANHLLLKHSGYDIDRSHQYVAPVYEQARIEDPVLLGLLQRVRPKYVIVGLGGGVQEVLGAYLRTNLDYTPGIICTGAAMAFLTGIQASIPPILDRLYLGWLARCISDPRRFVPRYWRGLKLIPMIIRERPEGDRP